MKAICSRSSRNRLLTLACSVSALALAFAPGIAAAQDTAAPEAQTATDADEASQEAIVVTGIRASLSSAQQVKRNSDTVVDAITAEDIGALPDRSVNEALQRIPGVAISRFASPSDSQHFSVQGSGVVVRGLSYVKGEFNGRDTFSVGGGREIGFSDVPSELVGSIEVYKNLTADMIEGGISGTVNINARKPLDSNKDLVYVSASMGLGDMEKRGSPSAVGLISKQFDLPGGGRFGILAAGTYSQIRSQSQSVYFSGWLPRQNDDKNGNGVQDPGEGHTINAGTAYETSLFDTYPGPAGKTVYTPLGPGFRDQHFNRERIGVSAAAQYENADRSLMVTAQYLRADSREAWVDHTVEGANWYGDITAVMPYGSTAPTYDGNGVATTGTFGRNTSPGGWFIDPTGNPAYANALPQYVNNGYELALTNRSFFTQSVTQDTALNVKWAPTERLRFNFDGQYVNSTVDNYDATVDGHTFSQIQIDRTSDIPDIKFITPGFDTASYFANPNNIFLNNASVNRAKNDGHEWAFQGDVEYDVSDDAFLRRLRVGGRYADRKQIVRSNDYNNWGSVSATWAYPSGAVSLAQAGASSNLTFDNFMRGSVTQPPSSVYIPNNILTNDKALMAYLRNAVSLSGGAGNYTPLQDRTNVNGGPLVDGYFRDNEIYRNGEETIAAYVRADFGVDAPFGGDTRLSGNIGVRWVHTKDTAVGGVTFPRPEQVFQPDGAGTNPDGSPRPPRWSTIPQYCTYVAANPGEFNPTPALCTIPLQDALNAYAFANGASIADEASQSYDHWLPALNVRLDLTPKFLMRFAASKAISRPNFGDLRDFIGVSPAGGNRAGLYGFSLTGRNPYLRPVEATQFDLTAEWYFAKIGQLTGALFYKTLDNIILDNSPFVRTFTNNGQTYAVAGNGPVNSEGTGRIKGAEVSYQQTYDFLPGALGGLGLQATYTFVDTNSLPNVPPANNAADGNRPVVDVTGLYDNLPLAGLSRHNVNVAGFYDRGGLYARVAYSWRSKFLLSNRDCCFPFLPVYAQASGQLDASLFYAINTQFKIGFEAANLLDTTTKTSYLLSSDGTEAPRTFFKSDRQFTVSVRITM
jgi:TonB-dependent receptor